MKIPSFQQYALCAIFMSMKKSGCMFIVEPLTEMRVNCNGRESNRYAIDNVNPSMLKYPLKNVTYTYDTGVIIV